MSTIESANGHHWADALNQGPAAARAMLDHDVSFDRIPYFFSDQYERSRQEIARAKLRDPDTPPESLVAGPTRR